MQNAQSPIFVSPSTHTTQLFSPSPSQTQQSFELPQPTQKRQIAKSIKKLDLFLERKLCIISPYIFH